jgi:hypothetical protein
MTTKRTMLDISEDLTALDDLLAECGGDISNPDVAAAVEQWFVELDMDFNRKADNYAALISEMRKRSEARFDESQRLAKRAAADDAAADWLASRLLSALVSRNVKRLETDRYAISVATNGGKAPLEINGDVPPEFVRVQTSEVVDREAIRTALEHGQSLPFARLLERGKRLTIR